MEAFSHAVGNLLKEFSALLSQTPTPITSNRLLQLMAINMFAVENTNVKGKDCERNQCKMDDWPNAEEEWYAEREREKDGGWGE